MNLKNHAKANRAGSLSPELFRKLHNRQTILEDTDSYKLSQFLQYPENMTAYFGYIESRGGEHDKTVFYGLQYYLKQYLSVPITSEDVVEMELFALKHGEPFNKEGWMYIVNELKGRLPVTIKAVPEGSVVPTKNVLATIESTDPKVPWVAGWVETMLLRVWYPTTIATRGYAIKEFLKEMLISTSGSKEGVEFMLHDFGSRGASSRETAAIGGSAHLVNFLGTDTIVGARLANLCYGVEGDMSGFSIPASEHSTMTSWGKEGEADAYQNMINQFSGENRIYACVMDSYDIYNAVDNILGKELRESVIKSGGTLVVRPDSGDPVKVVIDCLQMLEKNFGTKTNEKGFKVLNHTKVIQGDGIDPGIIREICFAVRNMRFCVSNLAFGMGGALLQKVERDTQKFAMKCSAVRVNGVWREVFKDPITDKGKASKKGRLTLCKDENGRYTTQDLLRPTEGELALVEVFRDGEVLIDYSFDEIRKRTEEA